MLELYLGIAGTVFILIAFVLDEFLQAFNQNTITYNLFNIFGAGLLLYYAYTLTSWPFVALNAFWILAAVIKIVRISSGKTDEDEFGPSVNISLKR